MSRFAALKNLTSPEVRYSKAEETCSRTVDKQASSNIVKHQREILPTTKQGKSS